MLVKPIMERNQVKRVNLRLYESDAEPRRYAAFVRHVGEMMDREGKTLASEGSEWEVAWKAFADEFRALTGVEWSEREKEEARGGEAARRTGERSLRELPDHDLASLVGILTGSRDPQHGQLSR